MTLKLYKGIDVVQAKSRIQWRNWLLKNHEANNSVWLVISHKNSSKDSVTYEDAVEEALCFGWIDSVANKRDDESKFQFFAKRKPKSNWSKSNRERVARMISLKLMTPAGMKMVELAKKSGTWEALVDVQANVIPNDLKKCFSKNSKARENFSKFPPSSKRITLEWILNAKRPETRQKRIDETVSLAEKNIKANHYRQRLG